jgi:hypothetical protein
VTTGTRSLVLYKIYFHHRFYLAKLPPEQFFFLMPDVRLLWSWPDRLFSSEQSPKLQIGTKRDTAEFQELLCPGNLEKMIPGWNLVK